MRLDHLVARYGLFAVALGAALEGETAVATGGLLARHGLLPLPGVIIAALAGSFAMDQLYFAIGRRGRDGRLVARAREHPTFARVLKAIDRHPVAFILSFRFVWGIRTVSPLAIGTSSVDWRRFIALNAVAAAVWAAAISAAGYLFGAGLHAIGLPPRSVWHLLGAAVALAVLAAASALIVRKRWLNRSR